MGNDVFEVYALEPADGAGLTRHVGTYRGYEAALAARDEDVIAQLAACGGWYRVFDHVIVGPGLEGPRSSILHATAIGVDPTGDVVPCADDLTEARAWLRSIHGRPTG